jgi:hypothetical protein
MTSRLGSGVEIRRLLRIIDGRAWASPHFDRRHVSEGLQRAWRGIAARRGGFQRGLAPERAGGLLVGAMVARRRAAGAFFRGKAFQASGAPA